LGAVPNPLNPSTTIKFILAEDNRVEIGVYDLKGRIVRDLLMSELPAGENSVQWDGRTDSGVNAAGGVYLVRIKTGSAEATIKITLAK
jgi:flagellar hook assembly protein FlgD